MFLTRDEVTAHAELEGVSRFVVIRDLRDTLISLYFSLKVSHASGHRLVDSTREMLQDLSEEEGLLHLIENNLSRIAALQTSWLGHDDLVLSYEDLITNPISTLKNALIERLRLPVSVAALERAVRRTHFQKVFRRRLGEEQIESHGRQGLPGDWQARFSPTVRRRFAERYQDVLKVTGYETDDRWVDAA